jgi:hypothetical protein
MTKRIRRPTAKPNQLKVQYGKLPGDKPDLTYVWGPGCDRTDYMVLMQGLNLKPFDRLTDSYEDSVLKQLEERGYDITTLKFSIEKLP